MSHRNGRVRTRFRVGGVGSLEIRGLQVEREGLRAAGADVGPALVFRVGEGGKREFHVGFELLVRSGDVLAAGPCERPFRVLPEPAGPVAREVGRSEEIFAAARRPASNRLPVAADDVGLSMIRKERPVFLQRCDTRVVPAKVGLRIVEKATRRQLLGVRHPLPHRRLSVLHVLRREFLHVRRGGGDVPFEQAQDRGRSPVGLGRLGLRREGDRRQGTGKDFAEGDDRLLRLPAEDGPIGVGAADGFVDPDGHSGRVRVQHVQVPPAGPPGERSLRFGEKGRRRAQVGKVRFRLFLCGRVLLRVDRFRQERGCRFVVPEGGERRGPSPLGAVSGGDGRRGEGAGDRLEESDVVDEQRGLRRGGAGLDDQRRNKSSGRVQTGRGYDIGLPAVGGRLAPDPVEADEFADDVPVLVVEDDGETDGRIGPPRRERDRGINHRAEALVGPEEESRPGLLRGEGDRPCT